MDKKLTMLMILDGLGNSTESQGNPMMEAETPNLDRLMKTYPTAEMSTSGRDVGLPDGQMGNSEVGHINIGAGQVVYSEPMEITKSIEDGDFFSIEELLGAIEHCKKNGSKLHLMGLASEGGVHAYLRHLYALLELAGRKDFEEVYIHAFTDGRDTSPTSGEGYLSQLEAKIEEKGIGKIATVSGRYYAMDRDNRYERIEKVYRALINAEGEKASSALAAVEESYRKEIFDEFIDPTIIMSGDKPVATIEDGDAVIFFNFRHDRGRQLTRSIVDNEFKEFDRTKFENLYFVCMTEYDSTMPNVHIAFKPRPVENTFGEHISKLGLTQARISETEKYAHVTFFFNGGSNEVPFPGEDRILVPSPKVATYDLQPEMSIDEVTAKTIDAINSRKYDVIVLNYANLDMVGHTGNMEAAIKSVEAVDEAIGKVIDVIERNGDKAIVTADHGNIEQMVNYKTGEPHTAHTTNLTPIILVGAENTKLKSGRLADIAPTMLDLMGLEKPSQMTGESLLIK